MKSKRERQAKKILDSLREPAPLNNNHGPLVREFTISHSKKDRKRKGRVEARMAHPNMKWKEVHDLGIEPIKYYDDWRDKRDGFRYHTNPDQLYHKWKASGQNIETVYKQNNKLIKQIKIRKAKLARKKKQ